MAGRPVIGLAPKGSAGTGRPVIGLAPTPGATKHHGDGLLGTIVHVLKQTPEDLANVAIHAPQGIYDVNRALVHDVVRGEGSPFAKHGGEKSQLLEIAAGTGKQIAGDLHHPLRHPGNTVLDVLPGLNAVSKLGEAGRIAAAGGRARDVLRTATRPAAPEPRVVRLPGGKTVEAGVYSRSALGRAAQKGLDRLRERYPDVKFGLRNQYERAGFERAQNERVRTALANAPAQALFVKARRLPKPALLSIRVVAEGVPLQERIADAERFLAESAGATRRQLTSHLNQLRHAATYVEDVTLPDGRSVPKFRAGQTRLEQLYDDTKRVADAREQQLVDAGMLDASTAAARKQAPGEIIRGAVRPGAQLQLGFDAEHVPEVFHHEGGFFVSYRNKRAPKSLGKVPRVGNAESVGIPRGLPELGHEFTGASLRTGAVQPNTVRQVGEDAIRANQLLSLWRQRNELGRLADDTKLSDYHVPIRPLWLKNKTWPAEVRGLIDQLDEGVTPDVRSSPVDRFREWFTFGGGSDVAALRDAEKAGGVKWIDARLLDRFNAPAHELPANRVVKTIDAVNQAERAAILFKPGYVLPNLTSNIALNIVQQGFAAIPNLTRAAKINTQLSVDDVARLDAAVGNGVVASLGSRGIGHAAIAAVQNVLGKLVDTAPRRAAFLAEAHRFGFRTPRDVARLLNDPKLEPTLVRVAREAAGEIIDYGRLGPWERGVIRRLVFVYPWVKGSTVYAGRVVREHPVKTGAIAAAGQEGKQRSDAELGPLPSYLDGLVRVGGTEDRPLIVNPSGLSPFGTPAQVLKTIAGLAQANPGKAYQLSEFLMPLLQAEAQGAQRHHGSFLGNVAHGSVENLPPVLLEQRLAHPPASSSTPRIYPYTRLEALVAYLLGSPTPHHLNRRNANDAAYAESTGR